jgi:protein-S-isoprenylcysteine O-methyltransferase Ste14
MLKQRSIWIYLLYVGGMIFSAWLAGIFESDDSPGNVTGWDLFQTLAGLVVLMACTVGFFVTLAKNRQPLTDNERQKWEVVRPKGKYRYIRNFVLTISPAILLSLALVVLYEYESGKPFLQTLQTYSVLAVVFVGLVVFAAFQFWNYYERE